ncbi:MAG: ATP synthase F1 subunit delta [Acidobacteria bacterium]|nr:ATP synthase F1 subunit delta [Acidobacteriota bacterium]
MINEAVARRYAKGLLGAALDRNEPLEPMVEKLTELAAAVESHSGLELLLLNPAVEPDKKVAVLNEIAATVGAGEMVQRFLTALGQNERLDHLRAAVKVFAAMADDELGVVNAEITSPQPLDEAAVTDLEQKLAQAAGRAVRLDMKTDPDMLGGLTTRIGDVVYDGSLRHQLAQMRARITAN